MVASKGARYVALITAEEKIGVMREGLVKA